jgi:hypothetical protein
MGRTVEVGHDKLLNLLDSGSPSTAPAFPSISLPLVRAERADSSVPANLGIVKAGTAARPFHAALGFRYGPFFKGYRPRFVILSLG